MLKFLIALSLVVTMLGLPVWLSSGTAQPGSATPDPDKPEDLAPAYSGCGGALAPPVNADYEQQVVELVNQTRSDYGLAPLKRVDALDDAARYHATDLGQDNYFNHDTYDRQGGDLVWICSPWDRVGTYYSGMRGENIAAGYETPEIVLQAWMDSSGHRANILSASSREIGVGYFDGRGDYWQYWVQDFGTRRDVYPLIINGEAAATDTRAVSLYIYGDWQEMRLRNDNEAWTTWQPFQAKLEWTLGAGAGERQVFAELRSPGITAASNDAIYLTVDGAHPALGNLPTDLTFTYSIPDQMLFPPNEQLTPRNVGSSDPLTWEISTQGGFIAVDPLAGITPASFTVRPADYDLDRPDTYHGNVIVTAVEPSSVEGSPHTIAVTLRVIGSKLYQTFLPGVLGQ
jgi:uncharacterized protein YkwD